jgi:hypothetical protein
MAKQITQLRSRDARVVQLEVAYNPGYSGRPWR